MCAHLFALANRIPRHLLSHPNASNSAFCIQAMQAQLQSAVCLILSPYLSPPSSLCSGERNQAALPYVRMNSGSAAFRQPCPVSFPSGPTYLGRVKLHVFMQWLILHGGRINRTLHSAFSFSSMLPDFSPLNPPILGDFPSPQCPFTRKGPCRSFHNWF
jgi:hypothetical protein